MLISSAKSQMRQNQTSKLRLLSGCLLIDENHRIFVTITLNIYQGVRGEQGRGLHLFSVGASGYTLDQSFCFLIRFLGQLVRTSINFGALKLTIGQIFQWPQVLNVWPPLESNMRPHRERALIVFSCPLNQTLRVDNGLELLNLMK